ncbi:MAG: sulfite exporter TauE/SafE family protein [Candidatus Nanopelagicales bacterium]
MDLVTIAAFGLVGAAAQFVDGLLGMGFGITSATLLTLLGYSAVAASAGTHAAKVGTTFVSGISHWHAGNVDKRVLLVIAVPGAVGAFLGAVVLTNIAMDGARVWMALILALMGVIIILRFGFGKNLIPAINARTRHLWPVGLIGGFVDATGGGGWGPVATPSLMTLTKHEPHRVVGTVNTAEFIVAVSASMGFLVGAGESGIPWLAVIGLIAGGAITAPIAARLAHRAPRMILGVFVGTMVLISNWAIFAKLLGVPGLAAAFGVAALVAAGAVIGIRAHRRERVVAPVAVSPDVVSTPA